MIIIIIRVLIEVKTTVIMEALVTITIIKTVIRIIYRRNSMEKEKK